MTDFNKQAKPKTIKIHLIEMLNLLVQIKRTRLNVPNEGYNRVIDSELIAAIKRCENEEQAIFEMSYPLSDPGMLHGFMGVKSYMLNLFYENIFCSRFDAADIDWLVGIHNGGDETHQYNIYNKIYINALFCEYLQKDIGSLILKPEDCVSAQKLLGSLDEQKQYELLAETSNRMSAPETHNYDARFFERVSPKILTAIKKKKLASVITVDNK